MEKQENKVKVIDRRINALPEKPQDGSFMAVIERLASRPDIDPQKIQQFMDMQEHILDRNAKQAFNAAMVRAQSKIKIVHADSKNIQTNSMYAKLDKIVKEIAPVYTGEGFSLSFYEGDTTKEKHIRIMCDIMHEQGYTLTRWVDMSLDDSGIKGSVNKTKIHAEGSSYSYGRRYLTCMIFNIPTGDDDDGNSAGGMQYISTDQQIEINDLIKEVEADKAKFLKFLKVDSVETIPSKAYKIAVTSLEAKRKAERQPGEDG
jgi:hypothetical protein